MKYLFKQNYLSYYLSLLYKSLLYLPHLYRYMFLNFSPQPILFLIQGILLYNYSESNH